MSLSEQVQSELAALLAAYLRGEATVDDILAFEGPYSLDPRLDPALRRRLDLLALIAEEVEYLDRPQADFDAMVREVVAELPSPLAAAVPAEAAAD